MYIFVLVNLWVSRARATKKPTITMTISDKSRHGSMSQRWLLLFHWHAPCLWQKCLDWLVGTAAPHRKWRLPSFPSACKWSLILVQLSGTFTKRWIPLPNSAKSCIFEGTAICQRIKAESQGTAAQQSNLSISGQILPAVDWVRWAKMIRGDNSGDSSSFAAKLSPWCTGGGKL